MKQTLTEKIFATDCPYENPAQTKAKRLLFVCSVGLLRSPTAQIVASTMGYNARACGSNVELALIPMSCKLIDWANHIIFMNRGNLDQSLKVFSVVGYAE